MGIFVNQENKIVCGKCNTEFDLNKNKNGCPLCGFGKKNHQVDQDEIQLNLSNIKENKINYFKIPPLMNLKSGYVIVSRESKIWGTWLMFNDFFAPKFLSRVLAWKLYKEKSDFILLSDLINNSLELIKEHNLSGLKGFPNLGKDKEGNRLVNHFLKTFVDMGLIIAEPIEKIAKDVWKESRDKIKISLTKEGLEFARLENNVFDNGENKQILTSEEKNWLIDYYKKIDKKDYKEYSVLKEVYDFLKTGNNGNQDLWDWFEDNEKFQEYIKYRSEKAKNDDRIFRKQLHNYARTFASAKISLLRELGLVKNKRNDYTIVGEM